jgi:hypothetical protein
MQTDEEIRRMLAGVKQRLHDAAKGVLNHSAFVAKHCTAEQPTQPYRKFHWGQIWGRWMTSSHT